MSVSQLAHEVVTSVDRLGQNDDLIRRIRAVQDFEQMISRTEPLVEQLEGTVAASKRAGLHVVPPPAADALSRLERLVPQLLAETLKVPDATAALEGLAEVLREATQAIVDSWAAYVDEVVPGAEGLLVVANAFSKIAGAGNQAQQLERSLLELQRIRKAKPSTTAVVQVERHAETVKGLLSELVGDDPEVRQFAKHLSEGGASVDDLTPGVLAWMRQKSFASSFKIVAGRPSGAAP